MKKTIVVFSVIMIIAITAIGCQKTPESPLIIGKSSDDLIDKASEGLGDESVAEKVNAPLQYEADFVNSDDSRFGKCRSRCAGSQHGTNYQNKHRLHIPRAGRCAAA